MSSALPEARREVALSELVDIRHGYAFRSEFFVPGPTSLALVTPGNFRRGGGFLDSDPKYYQGPVPPGFELAPGDLIVTMTDLSKSGDTLGFPALIPNADLTYLHNQRVGRVSARPGALIDVRYLYYLMSSAEYRHHVLATASGSTVRHTAPGRIGSFRFELPQLVDQQAIGRALGALDDRVDVNRRIGETLEEVARALFTSWFVDFDPVRETSTVPDDIRRLFPERLVDSSIGPVPEGWEVAPLGGHVEVTRGLSYTGAGLADEGMPLHNLNSIREGGGYKESGIKYYEGEYRERDRVHPGDVIVANTEQGFEHLLIGYPAIVPRSFGDDGLYSQDLCRLRPLDNSPLTLRFVYLLLVGRRMHHQVAGYSNGTTVNHLAMNGLKKPLIAVPSSAVIERFAAIVAPMFDQQEALATESKTLVELRDTLLPKLISGEVRVGGSADANRRAED